MVGPKKKRKDGNEKDLNWGKRGLGNLKEKKKAVLCLNVPLRYSVCPDQDVVFYLQVCLFRTYCVCIAHDAEASIYGFNLPYLPLGSLR